MKIYFIIFSLIFIFFFLSYSFAQIENIPPEIKEEGKRVGETFLERFPQALKEVWKNEVLPIWNKMEEYSSYLWKTYLSPKLKNFWYSFLKPKILYLIEKIKVILGKEIEERKPQIKEEFQKEKEEMKKEIPETTKTIWQKLKEILQ